MAITASAVPKLLLRADDIWADNQTQADRIANVEAINAIVDNSTATISNVINETKDRTVTLTWVTACSPTAQDVTDNCTWMTEEAATASIDYALGYNKESGFRVDIDMYRGNEFAYLDLVARELITRDKVLAELIAGTAVTRLDSYIGTNTYTNGGMWTVSGTSTTIPADQWDATLIPKFLVAQRKNLFQSPYLLSGENLFVEYTRANAYVNNLDGKGQAALFAKYPMYFDLVNVDRLGSDQSATTATVANYKTYMIDKGALSFASKNYFSDIPETILGEAARVRYTMASRYIKGLKYDVQVTTKCTSGKVYEHHMLTTKFDIFNNPLGCSGTRTGVLAFTKQAGI